MSRIAHAQAWADRQYLWETHGPAYDMSDSIEDDLDRMLARPSKRLASTLIVEQIQHWFARGPETGSLNCPSDAEIAGLLDDPRVVEIAHRYGAGSLRGLPVELERIAP